MNHHERHEIHEQDRGSRVTANVAQVFNLPYRRLVVGRPLRGRCLEHATSCGLQIRDTAECNSALRCWRRAFVVGSQLCISVTIAGAGLGRIAASRTHIST
jgi:hypothetical protein